jgi:hypothetical protein
MQKKAQAEGVGSILVIFLTVIVGVILFQAIAGYTGGSTTNAVTYNETFTAPVNGTAYYFDGFSQFNSVTMTNSTANSAIGSGNYTITNNVVNPTTGNLAVKVVPDADCPGYCERSWRLYTTDAYTSTYVSSSAGRSMVGLILIFFALGVAIVVLVPTLRNGIIDLVS